jgi:hypothetical protein
VAGYLAEAIEGGGERSAVEIFDGAFGRGEGGGDDAD